MYPKKQHNPSNDELLQQTQTNPEAAAARGLWGDRDFLEHVSELNPQLKHTQFADFHGHGWVFRAVYKKDRHGWLLDHQGRIVEHATAADLKAAVDFPVKVKEQYRVSDDPARPKPKAYVDSRDGK